jgi:hypothetical protein
VKYTLLYPKATHLEEPASGIVYLDRLMDCFVCRDLTHFASLSLGVGMCSEKCAQRLSEERSSLTAASVQQSKPREKAA